MTANAHQKVTASHLHRDAYLYVRQSTVRQVFENTESTRRQYALRERAVAMGWPIERVIVIDSDLGQSGAPGVDREGFQKLVGDVGMDRAGIVLGLEVSRLRGGILNKARRGALKMPLPVGLVYDSDDNVVLDPDGQVQRSFEHLFETFERTGSATATVKHFREQGLRFPRRPRSGPRKGELVWESLRHWRVLRVLHNPRYAGAFCFGRTHTRKRGDGSIEVQALPRDEWITLLPDAHPGYIIWDQFEANLRRMRDNAQAHGSERRKSPPREGPALLQGLIVCGVCDYRMTVRYHMRKGVQSPQYVCQREGIDTSTPKCQSIPGAGIDQAMGELLVETVTPVTLEVALQVQAELEARVDEADALRRQRVERARQEAGPALVHGS